MRNQSPYIIDALGQELREGDLVTLHTRPNTSWKGYVGRVAKAASEMVEVEVVQAAGTGYSVGHKNRLRASSLRRIRDYSEAYE